MADMRTDRGRRSGNY